MDAHTEPILERLIVEPPDLWERWPQRAALAPKLVKDEGRRRLV
jgi:hypothetical protein